MTIFVIADTHIPDRLDKLPEKFLEQVKENDIILHAGDLVTRSVFEQLQSRAKVHAVCGNMDDFEVKYLLPKSKMVELNHLKIGILHGSGPPIGLAEKVFNGFREKPEIIIFGHSHLPYNRKIGSTLMFNPGSLSGNLMSTCSSYGILHIEDKSVWGEVIEI